MTASVIEDNRRGDEVGAVRRFKYGDNWICQRLSEHSDTQRTLTYMGIELFAFPAGRMDDPPAPIRYEGTIHLLPIVDDNRTFIEWPVTLHTTPGEEEAWQELFRRGFRNGPSCCGGRWRGSDCSVCFRLVIASASEAIQFGAKFCIAWSLSLLAMTTDTYNRLQDWRARAVRRSIAASCRPRPRLAARRPSPPDRCRRAPAPPSSQAHRCRCCRRRSGPRQSASPTAG